MKKVNNKETEASAVQKNIDVKNKKTPEWKNYSGYLINNAIYGRGQVDLLWNEIRILRNSVATLQSAVESRKAIKAKVA